jgi:hypothetical protein
MRKLYENNNLRVVGGNVMSVVQYYRTSYRGHKVAVIVGEVPEQVYRSKGLGEKIFERQATEVELKELIEIGKCYMVTLYRDVLKLINDERELLGIADPDFHRLKDRLLALLSRR